MAGGRVEVRKMERGCWAVSQGGMEAGESVAMMRILVGRRRASF